MSDCDGMEGLPAPNCAWPPPCKTRGRAQADGLFGEWEEPEGKKRQSISLIPFSMMQLYLQELSALLLAHLLVALRL